MSANSQNQTHTTTATTPLPLAIPRAGFSTSRPSMFPPSPSSPTSSQLASSLVNFGGPPTPGSPPSFPNSRRLSYTGGNFNFQDPFPSLSSPVSAPPMNDPGAPTHARSRSATLPSILTSTIPSFSSSARSSSITSPTLEKVREEPPLVRGWFRRAQSDTKKREKSPMRDAILTGQFLD